MLKFFTRIVASVLVASVLVDPTLASVFSNPLQSVEPSFVFTAQALALRPESMPQPGHKTFVTIAVVGLATSVLVAARAGSHLDWSHLWASAMTAVQHSWVHASLLISIWVAGAFQSDGRKGASPPKNVLEHAVLKHLETILLQMARVCDANVAKIQKAISTGDADADPSNSSHALSLWWDLKAKILKYLGYLNSATMEGQAADVLMHATSEGQIQVLKGLARVNPQWTWEIIYRLLATAQFYGEEHEKAMKTLPRNSLLLDSAQKDIFVNYVESIDGQIQMTRILAFLGDPAARKTIRDNFVIADKSGNDREVRAIAESAPQIGDPDIKPLLETALKNYESKMHGRLRPGTRLDEAVNWIEHSLWDMLIPQVELATALAKLGEKQLAISSLRKLLDLQISVQMQRDVRVPYKDKPNNPGIQAMVRQLEMILPRPDRHSTFSPSNEKDTTRGLQDTTGTYLYGIAERLVVLGDVEWTQRRLEDFFRVMGRANPADTGQKQAEVNSAASLALRLAARNAPGASDLIAYLLDPHPGVPGVPKADSAAGFVGPQLDDRRRISILADMTRRENLEAARDLSDMLEGLVYVPFEGYYHLPEWTPVFEIAAILLKEWGVADRPADGVAGITFTAISKTVMGLLLPILGSSLTLGLLHPGAHGRTSMSLFSGLSLGLGPWVQTAAIWLVGMTAHKMNPSLFDRRRMALSDA